MTPSPAKLAVTQLTLTAFRNHADLRLHVPEAGIIITGENGRGKTNILEAVSFLSPGRGMRSAALPEICPLTAPESGWFLAAEIAGHTGGNLHIGTGYDPGQMTQNQRARRLLRIDGQMEQNQARLGDYLSLLWLSPEQDQMFNSGTRPRRRLLDRMVFGLDSAHASRVSAYERVLRERSRILKSAQFTGKRPDADWLAALEKQMAEQAVAIAAARLDLVARLDQLAQDSLGDFPAARLRIAGEVEEALLTRPALDVEHDFVLHLAENRSVNPSPAGPHRSSLLVIHSETGQEAEFCSTGQRKALLLRLILAEARLIIGETARRPILLLDEVAAHLDAKRRAQLFTELAKLDCQCWLTGTDEAVFEGFDPAALRHAI